MAPGTPPVSAEVRRSVGTPTPRAGFLRGGLASAPHPERDGQLFSKSGRHAGLWAGGRSSWPQPLPVRVFPSSSRSRSWPIFRVRAGNWCTWVRALPLPFELHDRG